MTEKFMTLDTVEVLVSSDGKTIWVNSEEGCVLRIQNIKKFYLVDERKDKGE